MTDRIKPASNKSPSVNALANPLVRRLIDDAILFGLGVDRMPNGTLLVDAGIDDPGGIEAGRRIAEICLGGLGEVSFYRSDAFDRWPLGIHVHTCNPVLACLGSQYAGWRLSHSEGKDSFQALGSGPARCLAHKEPLFEELGYRDAAARTCLVLEVDRPPPEPLAERIARDCCVDTEALTLLLTPTRSLAGSVQVCARVLEVALHKVHELGFPLENVIDGTGSAPLAPPAPDFVQAMGRTNDAILFGGKVQLYVRGDDEAAQQLAESLPSSASRDYGRPFAEIFKAFDYDFFKIDPMLFSPAQVVVSVLDSGRSFHAGRLDAELLELSFGATG